MINMLCLKHSALILLLCGCRLFSVNGFRSRIVNGSDAQEGEFPFMTSLRSRGGDHLCGSTILNEIWVLTAAHCVFEHVPKGLSLQYGSTGISANGSNIVSIRELHIHSQYNPASYQNDIALLKLETAIKFSGTTKPVKWASEELPNGAMATLIGWGQNQSGGQKQKKLQKVNLFHIEREECLKIHVHTIFESNICVGIPGGGKGQCTGDSGGPLLFEGYQHGIISWSVKPCAMGPYPGVMTKVLFYSDWISRVTGVTYY